MSILASLVSAYGKLPEAPPFGFSSEKVSYLISLSEDGSPACPPVDLRIETEKKRQARLLAVPASFKRPGVSPRAFFLWDNTAFVLGVSAIDGRNCEARHQAFRNLHLEALRNTSDPGLLALKKFVQNWSPPDFMRLGWPEDMKDQNVVFALESERRTCMIHERPAAKALWATLSGRAEKSQTICLVTGENAPVARLHPAIKGVWGAQTVGASLVSFNLDAFTSYGHMQGDNAPVSEFAAFAYGTALNEFLKADGGHRVQLGDASTVFWAHASDDRASKEAEDLFAAMFEGGDEETQPQQISKRLEKMRDGAPLDTIAPELAKGVRFSILGLSPNAARLSVRFWFEEDFATIARNYQRFVEDTRIDPPPRPTYPALWRYIVQAAALGKHENVPPNLAGDWMRAILAGTNYPLTLLSTTLMRLRADKDVNALRASILKALLIRNFGRRNITVALNMDNTDTGYLLGRLFATYEHVQSAALGGRVNATIKDKYYGAASAQPRKVFALLDKGSANHLSKVGKLSPGRRVNLEKQLGAIMDRMAPQSDPFPASLSAEEQALFGLGYYHQRNEFFRSKNDQTVSQGSAQ